MSESYTVLKEFFENRPACKEALAKLKSGVEIGILIDGEPACALFSEGGQPKFLDREANKPDVVFSVNSKAVQAISKNLGENVGDLSVQILKEVKNQNMSIRVPGGFMAIMRNGYLSIIKLGGRQMWDYLAKHGISNIGKVTSIIKDLMKKK